MSVDALDSNIVSFYLKGNLSVIENIEDADILIAAFCLYNNYILVTDNTKHFINIKGLNTVNWR
jgi:predicted nucleic acid-binding protein